MENKIYTINLGQFIACKNKDFHIFNDELNQISHDAVKIGGKIDKNEATLKHTKSEITNCYTLFQC